MTSCTEQSTAPRHWIFIEGVYHDISNLCCRDQKIQTDQPHVLEPKRSEILKSTEKEAKSPYTFDRALLKSVLDGADPMRAQPARRQSIDSSTIPMASSLRLRLSFSCSSLSSASIADSYDEDEDEQPVPTEVSDDEASLCDSDTSFYSGDYEEEYLCQGVNIPASSQIPTFRGADETWEAFKTGRFCLSTCLDCGERIVSVNDAAYVICARCRLVYPFQPPSKTTRQFGIAMGFKPSWCHTLLKENTNLIGGSNSMRALA